MLASGITFLSVLTAFVSALYAIDAYLCSRNVPNEPPIQKSSVPLFGHVFGFVMNGTGYFAKLRVPPSKLMYTMRILSLKVYVVNSTSLFIAVQRAAKTISFRPFERLTVERFAEASPEELALCDNGGDYDGDGILVREIEEVIRKALSPGPDLDRMNMDTAMGISQCLDDMLADDSGMSDGVDLYDWTRDSITVASGRGVYGPMHPYISREARDAFWEFESKSPIILLGFKWLVPKAYAASQRLLHHFESYFQNHGEQQASALVQGRARVFCHHNFDYNTCARMECSLSIAILSNTVPSSFWTLYEIYSRPALLAKIRASLEAAVTTSSAATSDIKSDRATTALEQHHRHHRLDLAVVKTRCDILLSTFQEMQRTRGSSASVRKVMADTMLDGQYLLKKGNYVQLPTAPVHRSTTLWGSNVGSFDPDRFHDRAAGDKIKPTSLLAWGFAPHMCPARQFATAEILVLVALTVLRFELVPVGVGMGKVRDSKGWEELGALTSGIGTVQPPKKHIRVKFVPRGEWLGTWSVDVGSSGSKFALVSG